MNKESILTYLKHWPQRTDDKVSNPNRFKAHGWEWIRQFHNGWELERNGGFCEEDLITKRDWDIKKKGKTQVLLDEALIRIKHLEERLLNEVPRGREMGT